jgi:hypothetical protein
MDNFEDTLMNISLMLVPIIFIGMIGALIFG